MQLTLRNFFCEASLIVVAGNTVPKVFPFFFFSARLALTSFLGLGTCLNRMVDSCSQLSLLRHAIDSLIAGLEVESSNFARITNDMVHLHKKDYVIAWFKDESSAQSIVSQVVEFLQSRGLEVGSKLVGSDLFTASSSSSKLPAQSETAAPSEDVQMREAMKGNLTLKGEASRLRY